MSSKATSAMMLPRFSNGLNNKVFSVKRNMVLDRFGEGWRFTGPADRDGARRGSLKLTVELCLPDDGHVACKWLRAKSQFRVSFLESK